MKKYLTLVLVVVLSLLGHAGKNSNFVTLSGEFGKERDVQFQLYQISGTKEINKKFDKKCKKKFKVKLSLANSYILKFTSKSGSVKYFYFNSNRSVDLALSIDFSRKASAKFLCRDHKLNYKIFEFKKEEIQTYFN
jgi:hypothetical protein